RAAGAHAFGSWTVVTAADCFTAGSETRSCADCAEVETRVISVLDHVLGPWTVIIAATCTTPGEEVRSCTLCNDVIETRAIAPVDCVDTTGDGKCDFCGNELATTPQLPPERNCLWNILGILLGAVLTVVFTVFFVRSALRI
ncbi:MAG: hypothetical protein FWD06_05395, partial [Oscillospiraceae bacterium]|nr:hypothetical protein [Oscillospiraceae bacterium]